MSWGLALGLMLGSLVFMMSLRLPVVFAFFAVNIMGALIFLGGDLQLIPLATGENPGLIQLVRNVSGQVANFSLIPIPLFLLMGEIMFYTGMADKAIDAVDRLISRVPGRLAIVAITGGTIFASLSGSSMANTAMLGSTLLPEMRRRGYDPGLSMGSIMGTGGIAMLIPPSGLAVLLGSLGKIPIADLLIAGIVPGLMIAGLFFVYVIIRCAMNPRLAPAGERLEMPLRERVMPFLIYVLPLLSIFIVVVGSILGGFATPTESAALGSLASFIAAIAYRKLTWKALSKSLLETGKISAMIFFIASASLTFSQILAFSGATSGMLTLVTEAQLTPFMVIGLMLLILLFMGCFMDSLSMMLITLPIFVPLAQHMGMDLVWFGILFLLVIEISFCTPPFGMLLYVMKGVAPPDITMRQVWAAAAPFVGLELIVLAVLFSYPPLVTWVPEMLRVTP